MDGVFMKKVITIFVCSLLIASAVYLKDVWQDKRVLQESLIRLHVVGNSNSEQDQYVKLQVKDAVVSYLQPLMENVSNKEQAQNFLRDNLATIEQVANVVLEELGEVSRAVVSLGEEAFDTRIYDTFSLPAGIYDSLRIRIGEAEGKNWWCVVFPSLCLPVTSDEFQDTAVSSGFSARSYKAFNNKYTEVILC